MESAQAPSESLRSFVAQGLAQGLQELQVLPAQVPVPVEEWVPGRVRGLAPAPRQVVEWLEREKLGQRVAPVPGYPA